MSHPASHPSPEVLNRLLEGRLEGKQAEAVNAILDQCPECQERLDAILRDRAMHRFGSGERELPELPAGTVLGGRFVIRRTVARGGQGAVYQASHIDQRGEVRAVAVKVFDLGHWDAEGRYDLFRTEVLAHANLTHPHIVPIYDFGEHFWSADGTDRPRRLAFYAMELLEGETLERRLRPVQSAGT